MYRFALLALVVLLPGCGSPALFIANTLAALDDYDAHRDIRYGEQPLETLDVYSPANANGSPVIVFYYGGCWGACLDYTKSSYAFVAQAFTRQGYVVVVPDYPHYPDVLYPGIMASAARSLAWVRQNIHRYGGDKERVLLAGHSAGAHIASMLALDDRWLPPDLDGSLRGFIGLAGPYDFLPFTDAYQFELFGPEERFAQSQPINFVDGEEVTMLLLHGLDDTRVRPKNTRSLAARLHSHNSKVDAIFYEDIDHAGLLAALARPFRDSRPVMQDIKRFLDEVAPVDRAAAPAS